MPVRATSTSVSIDDLAAKWGFSATSLTREVLEAADGGAKGYKNDGKVSLAELKASILEPKSSAITSTDTALRLKELLGQADPVAGAKISAMAGWAKTIAKEIDAGATAGRKDGFLTLDELTDYIENGPKLGTSQVSLLTGQRIAVLRAQIAEAVGKGDYLSGTSKQPGRRITTDYFTAMYDDEKKIPMWVSYMLDGSDSTLRPEVKRKDAFRADPQLVPFGVHALPKWYEHSGYDQGHMMPYEDHCDPQSARDTFLMSNIAPQTGELNSNAWKTIEAGMRQMVLASGAKATIFTGSLFLDSKNKPLKDEKIQWIGPDAATGGPKRVAVPTHCYKAILLTLPDGSQAAYAYLLPNTTTVPTKKPQVTKFIQDSIMSVADLEKIAGQKFFTGLSAAKAKDLKSKPERLDDVMALVMARNTPAGVSFTSPDALNAYLFGENGIYEDLGALWKKSVAK